MWLRCRQEGCPVLVETTTKAVMTGWPRHHQQALRASVVARLVEGDTEESRELAAHQATALLAQFSSAVLPLNAVGGHDDV